jgi:UDP-N-acetylglucosamine--N-acetylmuramyl-(pentapeptide) pyrophosphoryl-undecaprenol N-acetylglucosamine transferase
MASGEHGELQAERRAFRVLMAAGGTGGHIFPALAVAEELRRRAERRGPDGPDCAIEFLGTGRGLESRLIPAAGFPLRMVSAAGLKGIGGWRKLQNLFVLPRSAVETALVLREFQPDVVVGMGGYSAGPAMLEAALRDIPTLLIEPNVTPGFTNRVLAPVVWLAAVGFAEAAQFYGAKARVTGHPVREAFFRIPPKPHIPPFAVMILGGSQGAAAINACIMKCLPLFAAEGPGLRFIHQTGERDYNEVRQAYAEQRIAAEVYAFIDNVAEVFARADLVISRAGALTVAELAAAGKAAVLIPFAAATDQHQLENARALERAGAAVVILQSELTPPVLVAAVRELLECPARLEEMEQRARSLARPDAAARIADLIEELAK